MTVKGCCFWLLSAVRSTPKRMAARVSPGRRSPNPPKYKAYQQPDFHTDDANRLRHLGSGAPLDCRSAHEGRVLRAPWRWPPPFRACARPRQPPGAVPRRTAVRSLAGAPRPAPREQAPRASGPGELSPRLGSLQTARARRRHQGKGGRGSARPRVQGRRDPRTALNAPPLRRSCAAA